MNLKAFSPITFARAQNSDKFQRKLYYAKDLTRKTAQLLQGLD